MGNVIRSCISHRSFGFRPWKLQDIRCKFAKAACKDVVWPIPEMTIQSSLLREVHKGDPRALIREIQASTLLSERVFNAEYVEQSCSSSSALSALRELVKLAGDVRDSLVEHREIESENSRYMSGDFASQRGRYVDE